MFKVVIYKTFTNDNFLEQELTDDEYQLELFSYKIGTVTHLSFVPPIGLEVRLRDTNYRVDTLMFDVVNSCFYVYETVDVTNIDLAKKLVSKYLQDGWQLAPTK